jgi:hypothetical protein
VPVELAYAVSGTTATTRNGNVVALPRLLAGNTTEEPELPSVVPGVPYTVATFVPTIVPLAPVTTLVLPVVVTATRKAADGSTTT